MKLLLNKEVKVKASNKSAVANMIKVANASRKQTDSKFIHFSAIRAYQRQKDWKLKVRAISNIQFASR
ncbi:hypothetical protein HN450_04545 [bacterium]|jgi:citrate lyase synthetase|nr:hypothetical protein [bacterium]MBT3850163.1 hypothetical protein [bacterium]MBT4434858.1 hypothetical protein [bacterium]MDG2445993.1 hypothetical protein [Thermodesulfobacteriota bacterium]|tara:strand:- start:4576 stop:4779 length:204 start_codon:yes stop_codon:yes gene_type:complete